MTAAAAVKKSSLKKPDQQQENGVEDKKNPPKEEPKMKKIASAVFEDLLAPAQLELEAKKEDDEKATLNQLPSVDPKLINSALSSKLASTKKSSNVNDLFQAHNFDINIDLSVPIAGKYLIYFINYKIKD
jgi:hypothetical protein